MIAVHRMHDKGFTNAMEQPTKECRILIVPNHSGLGFGIETRGYDMCPQTPNFSLVPAIIEDTGLKR
jgi:hypothetical protein